MGARTIQPVQNWIMNGSDYAGLSRSSSWPYPMLTTNVSGENHVFVLLEEIVKV